MSVPRGAQRAALVVLALALAATSAVAYQQAGRARDERIAEATSSAEQVAAALAPTLIHDDLGGAVGDDRSQEIAAALDAGVLRSEETAIVINRAAVVVFAADPSIVGERQSRAKVTRALSLGTQTELGGETFDVFVPVIVGAGSEENAIVKISSPSQPIGSARQPWLVVALVAAGFALLVFVASFVHSGGRSAGFGDAISPSRVLDIERRHQKELEGLEKTLERARADEAGVQAELERTSKDLEAHQRVLNELDESLTKAEARAGAAEGQLADARTAAAEAQARADHAEAGEGEARARITAAESRAKDAERQAADATTRAKHAEEWAEELASIGEDLERAGSGEDAEFKKLRQSLLEAKRQAASVRDAKRALQERVDTLESERGFLQTERDTLAAEREPLTAERDALVAERAAVEQARDAAQEELAGTREQLERTKGELDETLASSKAQLANARRDLEEVGADVAAARSELDASRSREAQANAEVESLRAETARLRAELDAATTDADAARSATQAKSVQLAEASGQLATVQREAETLTEQLREQTERAAAAEAKVVELFHQVQELEQRPDLTEDLESARAEIDVLQTSLATANERAAALEGDVGLARSEVEVAQRAGAEVADRLNEQKVRGDAAEAEVADLKEEIAELSNVIAELEGRPDLTADLETSAAQVSKLMQRVAELEARPDLAGELGSARNEAGALAAQLETAASELAASRGEAEASRGELEATRAELEASRGEAEASRTQTGAVEADLEASRAETVAARTEADAAKAELEAARRDAEMAQAELEATRAAIGETQAGERSLQEELRVAREESGGHQLAEEGLRSELETAKAQLATVTTELEGSTTELGRTASELARVSAELEATTKELTETRSAAGRTEAEQRTLEEELRATSEAAETRRLEDERLRAEIEATKAEDERLRSEVETWRIEADELRAQLDLAKAEADGLRAESETLRAESESVRSGTESLRAESTELLGEKDRLIEQLQSAEWAAGQERARADDLALRQAELQAHADEVARKAAEEAMETRGRLMAAQEALARFQAELEETSTRGVTASQAGLDPDGVQEVVDALSTDAKRSLSAIFGLGRMISSHAPGQDEGRLLQQLMSQARRMEHALADILDAGRLARGEIILKRRSTEIDTLIRRVVREFPLAEEGQLDVLLDTATIQVDPARLERLIDDLLASAMTRTPRGERILLRLERTDDGVMLSVEGGAPSGIEVGTAAAFLAKLHGGSSSAEMLSGERGVARVFLPNTWAERPETSALGEDHVPGAEDGDEASDPTDHAAATA